MYCTLHPKICITPALNTVNYNYNYTFDLIRVQYDITIMTTFYGNGWRVVVDKNGYQTSDDCKSIISILEFKKTNNRNLYTEHRSLQKVGGKSTVFKHL